MSNGSYSHTAQRIPAGTRLNGIYEIDHAIGSGGMGEIYKGHNIQTGDLVAIKLMLPDLAENSAAMALFRKEASALHSLHHEAIVRYYVFTVEPVLQRPYLAMEFVEGQSLSQLLERGPLTLEAMYALKHRVATGLQAAHERGVIHRDVSPDNIIIPGGDVSRAKIIDFGIARSTQMGDGTIIGGGFAGKYNYVSPEQLGLFGGNVTGKSDIYSLGLLLAEVLTGRPIDMGGSQVDIIEKRRRVPDLGAIDLRVRPLLEKMLQPDPANRPESMAVVAAWQVGAERVKEVRAASAPRAASSGAGEAQSRRGRGRTAALAAGVAVVILGGGGAGYYYLTQPDAAPPPAAPALAPVASLPTLPSQQPARPALEAPAVLRPEASPSAAPPALTPGGTTPAPSTAEPVPAAPVLAPQQPAARPDAPPQLTPALPAPPVEVTTRPTSPALVTPAPAPRIEPPRPLTTTPATPQVAAPPPRVEPPRPLTTTPSTPQVAALPPRPEPLPQVAPPAPLAPVDKVTRYINEYQGGDCFFIMPVAVSANAARIEGYGASIAPFNALDEAFKRANSFEADIGVRQVTNAQCPAITFLSRVRNDRGPTPRVQIAATSLKSGQALTGTVAGYGDRHVELLLVSDEGSVVNVSSLLKPAADGKSFNLRLQRTGAPGAQPQLLIAVASAQPLDTLRPRGAVEADLFFPLVAGEAARSGQPLWATATYFKLDL